MAEDSLSRRDFLKVAGVMGAAAAVGGVLEKWPVIDRYWKENEAALTGEIENLNLIISEVPESLEGKDIPTKNEWFRRADAIFVEGLELYGKWRSNDAGLDKLHYKKPENYLTVQLVAEKLGLKAGKDPIKFIRSLDNLDRFYYTLSYDNDILYSAFIIGAGQAIGGMDDMVILDPGTGILKDIRLSMKEKFGDQFDVASAFSHHVVTDEQRKFVTDKIHSWYFNTMEYVKGIRNKSSEPISTSILFAYFLHKNKGDILASAWDTATWLKILVRNDPDDGLGYDPNYDRAKLATDLFKDEFSPTISANWVVENVDKDDEVLNSINPYEFSQYKDYMPPNRAGAYYHAWVIMALGMSMQPFLVGRMIATHLNPATQTQYGRVRTMADMLVVDKVNEIDRIVNSFS